MHNRKYPTVNKNVLGNDGWNGQCVTQKTSRLKNSTEILLSSTRDHISTSRMIFHIQLHYIENYPSRRFENHIQ